MIVDTNVLSEVMRPVPNPAVADWFERTGQQARFITAVTEAELLFGIELMPEGKRRNTFALVIELLIRIDLQLPVLPFESADAPFYAKVSAMRRKIGRPVTVHDAQIAAIALRRGLPVATRNVRDFADCGVTLINPWDSAP
jgi:predicted nucleic acid-binding protein